MFSQSFAKILQEPTEPYPDHATMAVWRQVVHEQVANLLNRQVTFDNTNIDDSGSLYSSFSLLAFIQVSTETFLYSVFASAHSS